METGRRPVLITLGGVLTAGCTGRNGADPPDGGPPTQPGNDTPECDPAAVTRPPVATGTNIEGRAYPRKPDALTEQSIMEYLDEFETAFAWNRVLQTPDVTSLNVDNLDGFVPDETGDGYLASSGVRVTHSTEDGTTNENEYVANYFVSPGPVYRYESSNEPVTPQSQDETQLVQCGTDSDSK